MSDNKIDLVSAIQSLRVELRDAQDSAPADLKFTIEDIEVAFEVVTEKTAGVGGEVGGKIKFWLFDTEVSAQASGSYSRSQSHTVKLKLKPVDYRRNASGEDVEISRQADSPRKG